MEGRARDLFRLISQAPSERAVALALLDRGPEVVGAVAAGFYSMRDQTTPNDIYLRGLDERTAIFYEQEGRAIDPLFHWAWEHHSVAVAELASLAASAPLQAALDRARAQSLDLAEYMLVPVVVGGAVIGTAHFVNTGTQRFDRSFATAVAIHVSARMAVLRALDSFASAWDGALTSREQEVAELAARGLSSREMGRAAGISSNTIKKHLKQLYAKLGVSSRGELSSLLLRGPGAIAEVGNSRSQLRRQRLSTGVAVYWW